MSSLSRILNKEQVQLTESHLLLPSMKQEEDCNITFTAGDQLEGVLDTEDDGQNLGQLIWDFMDCDGFLSAAQEGDGRRFYQELDYHHHHSHQYLSVKQEKEEDDDDDERKLMSLNLRLNYQEILDAWSDRTPWADDDTSLLSANINNIVYTGEVPEKLMAEDRRRKEASVMRYREKRQTRLFSKKIRYQVRKQNAEKRPRLKGRFVKRAPAEKMI